MNFRQTFQILIEHQSYLKIVSVASADLKGRPNSAAKMLVDASVPNEIYYLDYTFTQSFANVTVNPQISLSFMDDDSFTGYRFTGTAEVLKEGPFFEEAQRKWKKRLISYEADRILKRSRGQYSSREAENTLPGEYLIVKVTAQEASVIKPDRVFRTLYGADRKKS